VRRNPDWVSCPVPCNKDVFTSKNLAGDRRQQLHRLLEMGFLILSTLGAAVRAIPKVLKMADQAGDV